MKGYKRLTDKRESPLVMSMWAGTSEELKIYNRLAELEDKIENGTLIELLCKVGDMVYWISQRERDVVEVVVRRITIDEYGTTIIVEENGTDKYDLLIDDIYPTKAEAEAKLMELKGE